MKKEYLEPNIEIINIRIDADILSSSQEPHTEDPIVPTGSPTEWTDPFGE